MLNFIYSSDNTSTQKIPYSVWDSDSSNIGPTEVWFQDWVDYTRLFIKSVNDTVEIDKHPYSKTDFKKTYLNDKPIKKPTYIQLLGNVIWKEPQNWKYINTTLDGSAKIVNEKLHLKITDYDKVIIDTKSRIRKYK